MASLRSLAHDSVANFQAGPQKLSPRNKQASFWCSVTQFSLRKVQFVISAALDDFHEPFRSNNH